MREPHRTALDELYRAALPVLEQSSSEGPRGSEGPGAGQDHREGAASTSQQEVSR
jgi:hypothetical protein